MKYDQLSWLWNTKILFLKFVAMEIIYIRRSLTPDLKKNFELIVVYSANKWRRTTGFLLSILVGSYYICGSKLNMQSILCFLFHHFHRFSVHLLLFPFLAKYLHRYYLRVIVFARYLSLQSRWFLHQKIYFHKHNFVRHEQILDVETNMILPNAIKTH